MPKVNVFNADDISMTQLPTGWLFDSKDIPFQKLTTHKPQLTT